jgi:hypothetical protein
MKILSKFKVLSETTSDRQDLMITGLTNRSRRTVLSGPTASGLDVEPSRKAGMRRGVLMTILQQNAAQLPMFMGKPSEK